MRAQQHQPTMLTLGAGFMVLLAVMAVSYFADSPNGQHLQGLDFLLFWGQEVLIITLVLALMVARAMKAITQAD